MSDPIYPANGVQRRVLPTLPNAIVSKFDMNQGGRSTEEIEQEAGELAVLLVVDNCLQGEVEVIAKPNFTVPTQASNITFNVASASPNYPNFANANNLVMLVMDAPKYMGTAGKSVRYSFKVFANSLLP